MWIWTNINHYVVFLVQRQQSLHIIFWWGLTITKDFQYSVFACESSLPYTNYSWTSCMTNIVIVKLQKISLSKPNVKLPLGMIWTYNFRFMTFNSFNHLLTGYKWSTRVNDKLLQKDISEDQWVVKQLCSYVKTLSHLRISDLGILFKQQAKQNKMTFQG